MNEPLKSRTRICRQIKVLRKKQKISLRRLEELTGIDNSNLSSIELGQWNVGIDSLSLIAFALGYKLDFVPLGEEDEEDTEE